MGNGQTITGGVARAARPIAIKESFFATLKAECVHPSSFATHAQARTACFHYIEVFYNRQRRHSALGYLSPEEFEKRRQLCSNTPIT